MLGDWPCHRHLLLGGGELGHIWDTDPWWRRALLMTLPAHVNENHWSRCGWRRYTHDFRGVAGVGRMQDRCPEDQRTSWACQAKPDSWLLQLREETVSSRQSLLQMNHYPLGSTALGPATSSLNVPNLYQLSFWIKGLSS